MGGLPSVLIEALAVGCPVVSTDCPSGPREILDDGKYGRLVRVDDDGALAEGIAAALTGDARPAPGAWLERFSSEAMLRANLRLFHAASAHRLAASPQ